jgi:hypothetical protein
MRLHTTALLVAGLIFAASTARAKATIVIIDKDAAGQGFNDNTPFSPVGGNNATTLGQARMIAFQAAAAIWSTRLESSVEIDVDAQWAALACSIYSGVLGQAGTIAVFQNFSHAPYPNTSYAGALANALAGEDLDPKTSEIAATFNTALGTASCFPSNPWYFGLDGAGPSYAVDLVSIVAHELGHGLGFQTYINVSTGAKYAGMDDAYLLNLEQYGASPSVLRDMTDAERALADTSEPSLLWTGSQVTQAGLSTLTAGVNHGLVRLYGPNPIRVGSSVTHFSSVVNPSQLMRPDYIRAQHDPGLALPLLQDIGWPVPQPTQVPESNWWSIGLLACAFIAAAAFLTKQPHSDPQ